MAGAQTPWATELPAGGAVSNPFAEQVLPPGMPTLPPPPPPSAPGEDEAEAEAPSGRKLPLSKQVIAAIVAVVVLGGGGYYYLNSGSSSSSTPAPTTHTLTPAQLAALRAKGAAKAGTTKPTTAAVKPATPAKAVSPVKPATGAKAGNPATPAKAAAPAKTGTTVTSTQTASAATYTAALPGAINGWDKLIIKKVPNVLANFDKVLGASISNLQVGSFGGTSSDPYLQVAVGDHSKNPTGKAMDLLRQGLKEDRAAGIAVSASFFVPHTPWGGSAACATEAGTDAAGDDSSAVTCTWVDANTVGSIFATHRVASQALALLNSVRSQVEH